jgi:hypothetical protein
MAKVGCLLVILSLVGLGVIIVVPVLPFLNDTPQIDQYLQPLLCQPGETIQREQYSTRDRDGTSYSMDVYCISEDRTRRDVTLTWGLMGMGIFVVPFLIGLAALIIGLQRSQSGSETVSMSGGTWSAPAGGGSKPTLTQRLKELQDARDAGLISGMEYDRVRQQILDSMDD